MSITTVRRLDAVTAAAAATIVVSAASASVHHCFRADVHPAWLPVGLKVFEKMTIGDPKHVGRTNPNGADGKGLEYFGAASSAALTRRAADARPCRGQGVEPGLADGLVAALAHPVRPRLEAGECGLHLGQVVAHLLDQRTDLRALERDGVALGVMLVVGVGVEGGRHDVVEVAGQARQARCRPTPLLLQSLACLHVAIMSLGTDCTSSASSRRTEHDRIARCRSHDRAISGTISPVNTSTIIIA